MTPEQILNHYDTATTWINQEANADLTLPHAYNVAKALHDLRIERGESLVGIKIGLTNKLIWERLGIQEPMWGFVWDTTLFKIRGDQRPASLTGLVCPKIEPEIAFRLNKRPPNNPSLEELFCCIKTIAPAFELVQCHLDSWKFSPSQAICDGGLHGQLWLGEEVELEHYFFSPTHAIETVGTAVVRLSEQSGRSIDGLGANVMGNPFDSLARLVSMLYAFDNESFLTEDSIITTGSWTDAIPVDPGEKWSAKFSCFQDAIHLSFA
jgi:2-keto-4-pentenoate hydratase